MSNQNKIILAVAGVMLLAVILLFFTANSGGGGGGSSQGGTPSLPNGSADSGSSLLQSAETESGSSTPQSSPIETAAPKSIEDVTLNEPFDAETSPDVPTVTEVRASLASRGLEDAALTVAIDIKGEYTPNEIIKEDSGDKYPFYLVQYKSRTNVPWVIYINNGNYLATPLIGLENVNSRIIYISETEFMTIYDGEDNTFTNAVPMPEEASFVVVNRINSSTLDGWTQEELEQL